MQKERSIARPKATRNSTLIIITAAGLILAGCFVLVASLFLQMTPSAADLVSKNPTTTSFMQAKCKNRCALKWTNIEDVSPLIIDAIILAEDPRFFSHKGFDWQNLKAAFKANLRKGKIVWGGSSITMQLAKNLYLTPKKTFGRKIREMIIAHELEKNLSKRRILELYLNTAQFGSEIFGIANASGFYFDKDPNLLGPHEAALLASILPNPELISSKTFPESFVESGGLIFETLLDYYLPAPLSEDNVLACSDPLSSEDQQKAEYIIAKIFSEIAPEIKSGKASKLASSKLYAMLSADESAWLKRLLAKVENIRRPKSLACPRDFDEQQFAIFNQTDALGDVRSFWIAKGSAQSLQNLLETAASDGVFLKINSGYRAAGYQIFTILSMLRRNNFCLSETAKVVALPEESQHSCTNMQAIDFADADKNTLVAKDDPSYAWLSSNAFRFNFSLTYPQGTDNFEPWHWVWKP